MARTASYRDHAKRLEARRRAERGVVATYVDQLSDRHLTAADDDARAALGGTTGSARPADAGRTEER